MSLSIPSSVCLNIAETTEDEMPVASENASPVVEYRLTGKRPAVVTGVVMLYFLS